MILITATQRNGVTLLEPMTFAIDPEKIVSVRDRGDFYAEIEYGETFDRRRQPITYVLTTSRAAIDALILGTYATKEYLAVTVIGSNTDEYKPKRVANYALDLQEKYIVDIRDTYFAINGVKTACRRIEYVPGSFVPILIYVSNALNTLVTDTPDAVTTTTTTETPETTTTTTETEPQGPN